MTRKSQPTRVDEKTDAPESVDGDIDLRQIIEKTFDPVSRAVPLERESIIRGIVVLGFWEEFCRERESDLEGLCDSEIKKLFNRYPPWCEHVRWVQDYWCRDEPARLDLALYFLSRLSNAVTAGGTVINLPPCAEYDPKHPPDDFSDLHNHLFLWAQITGGVIYARPNDKTAPLQRFNESILIDARLTAQMVMRDMFEVLRPERGDSSSLFLCDVYVVAASAADRFDCQTGTIKPVAPAVVSHGEPDKVKADSIQRVRRKKGAPKVAEMKREIVNKFPNGEYLEPGRGAKYLGFEDSQVFQKALKELRDEAEGYKGDIK
jgi:hypothetical protein